MKNLITYLKALWRRVADSQSNDVSLDCRSTVVRPSFDRRSSLLKLVSVLVLILTVGVGNVWGYEIIFETGSNTGTKATTSTSCSSIVSDGSTYLTGNLVTATNVYDKTADNLRIGNSSAAGCIKMNLSASGQVSATTIVINAKQYSSGKGKTLSVNGSTAQTPADSWGDLTFTINSDITFLQLDATGYLYIKSITVNTSGGGSGSCDVFSETWDNTNGTGGNDDSWSGSIASSSIFSDNSGWTYANQGGANECVKLGTESKKGSAETPAITYSGSSNLVLTFKAAAWNGGSEGTTLNLSSTKCTLDKSSVTLVKGSWTTYTVNISSITTGFKIKWEAVNASNNRFFLDEICISEAAAPTTTVSAIPTSITFAANTLSGGEASGSSTIDISVTNGSQSSGQYLCAWPESDDANCAFTINNGAYSYCSGSATSVDDLSIEYYAIAAGTFTGRIYVNGYKANGDPVEETIELSVTISGPVCDKSVTISKGTETNCTFSLSPSGEQASCDGVSTTVTITPTSGYGNPSVTQSGASAAPTISGSSNTWTVAYAANTTGTSTINVSCSANNYTITLNTDLTPTSAGTTSITATYNANTNLTSAITKPTKTGWTFGGYFTAKNGGGTQIIDASGNVIASVSGYTDASKNWKYAGNITLYAKWTCEVTWSVNGATNVYSSQTVTYNSSGSKVASVPTPDPASYCGDIFAGWSAKNAGAESKTTSYYDDLFKTVGDSPDIKNIGDITFYAVFANEE